MIKYILTGTRKLTGIEAVITSTTMQEISGYVEDIVANQFDNKPNNDFILIESIKVTAEIVK